MKRIFLVILFVAMLPKAYSQLQYMDLATVSALIEANIQEHDNMVKRKNKGTEYSVVTAILKDEQGKVKELHNKLQSRMNSLFILLADAELILRIAQETQLIYKAQERALDLALSKPYLYPAVLQNEYQTVNRVKEMILFFTMIVNSYADIANMNVADRRKIYSQIVIDLTVIRLKSQAMEQTFKNMTFADAVKQTGIWNMVNDDIQQVNEIINSLQF